MKVWLHLKSSTLFDIVRIKKHVALMKGMMTTYMLSLLGRVAPLLNTSRLLSKVSVKGESGANMRASLY